jgi:hypothetical protein
MACNRCGHTKSSPCACQDHGLTTPCSYTNCETPACEELYCVECIVECTPPDREKGEIVWDAEQSAGTTSTRGIQARANDSSQEIMQRIALFAADPAGGAKTASLAIAPFYTANTTATTLDLLWKNVPSTATSISIYQAPEASTTWTLVTALTSKLATSTKYTISGLLPATGYKFKMICTDGTNSANTVAVYSTTKTVR